MKKLLKKTFEFWGYELKPKEINCYSIQKELIKKQKPIIFDVGAHTGHTALMYRKLFLSGLIYCFEPYTKSFEELQKKVAGDKNIFSYNIGISNKKEKAWFNMNKLAATNSLLATDKKGIQVWGENLLETSSKEKINTTTLDLFSKENKITLIDILKLDIQGAEFKVLSGAKQLLMNQSIDLIYTEIIIAETYKEQNKFHEYLKFLDSFGYKLLDFYNPVRKNTRLLQIDAIFLSKKIFSSV
ncbi:MAG: FkbM family methyltransferase [Spirochaetia bacterium]|nr:FkbM family methyltransferase [Spirochaetia bacterium]